MFIFWFPCSSVSFMKRGTKQHDDVAINNARFWCKTWIIFLFVLFYLPLIAIFIWECSTGFGLYGSLELYHVTLYFIALIIGTARSSMLAKLSYKVHLSVYMSNSLSVRDYKSLPSAGFQIRGLFSFLKRLFLDQILCLTTC